MSRRGCNCCTCSEEIRGDDSRFVYRDAAGDIIEPVFEAGGAVVMPLDGTAEIKVKMSSKHDAWEAIIGFNGHIEVDYDYTPLVEATESSPEVAEVPGVEFRATPAPSHPDYNNTWTVPGKGSDGGKAGTYVGIPSTANQVTHVYYRNTPNYVGGQFPLYKRNVYTTRELLSLNTNQPDGERMQMGIVDAEVPITGTIRIKCKSAGSWFSYLYYAAITRKWESEEYGYGYGYSSAYEEPCKPATPMYGCLEEMYQLHDYFNFGSKPDVVFIDKPHEIAFGSNGTCGLTGFGGFTTYPTGSEGVPSEDIRYSGDAGILRNALATIHDPPPDPATGELYPKPGGKVLVSATHAYFCMRKDPTDDIYYACKENGEISTYDDPTGLADRVEDTEEVVEYFDLATFRLGFSVTLNFNHSDSCHQDCDVGESEPPALNNVEDSASLRSPNFTMRYEV